MARREYKNHAVDTAGSVVPGAAFEVRSIADDSLATLYAARTGGTTVTNPGTAVNDGSDDGLINFWLDEFEDHYITIGSGAGAKTYPLPNLSTYTWRAFANLSAMEDVWAKYEAAGIIVPVGTIWNAGTVAYEYDGASTGLSNLQGWKVITQILSFADSSAAEGADIPEGIDRIVVRGEDTNGGKYNLPYHRDATADDLTTNDGATWKLDQKDTVQGQEFFVMGNQWVEEYGGICINDNPNVSKQRQVFQLNRTINVETADNWIDPGIGAFSSPVGAAFRFQISGTVGEQNQNSSRIINLNLQNDSDQPGIGVNAAVRNGHTGATGHGIASWGWLTEGYDLTAREGYIAGDPDQDENADIVGIGNTIVGQELNCKVKENGDFVALLCFAATYGRVVSEGTRPTITRLINTSPSKEGAAPTDEDVYLNSKVGANVDKHIMMNAQHNQSQGPGHAHSNYGLFASYPFLKAAIALPQDDGIVWDHDAGNPEQIFTYSPSAGVWAISMDGRDSHTVEVRPNNLLVNRSIDLDGTSAQNRTLAWTEEGDDRWAFNVDNSGNNILRLYGYDAGGTPSTFMQVNRSQNLLTLPQKVTVGDKLSLDGTAAENRTLAWTAEGSNRWAFDVDSSGNNIFRLYGYDAGGSAETFMQVNRSQSLMTFGQNVAFSTTPRLPTYTVALLPSASGKGAGAIAVVTNADTPTKGSTVTGGGSVVTPVVSDGTNWIVA